MAVHTLYLTVVEGKMSSLTEAKWLLILGACSGLGSLPILPLVCNVIFRICVEVISAHSYILWIHDPMNC